MRAACLSVLLLLAACGGKETEPESSGAGAGDGAAMAMAMGADGAPMAAGADNASAAAEPGTEPAAAEADPAAGEIEAAPAASLRDRVTTTPPPPVEDNPYYSTAVTLEERMANVRKALDRAGKDGIVILDMHDLGGWEFDEREKQPFPEYVRELEGRTVVVRGFMMPDIDFEHIRSFHVVRSLWGCCFGAPPRINEILRVTLSDKDGMDYTYNTLEVQGVFHAVFEMEDGMVDDVYRLDNAVAKERDYEDPQAPENFDATTGFEGILPVGSSEY